MLQLFQLEQDGVHKPVQSVHLLELPGDLIS